MKTNSESKMSFVLIGLGLTAIGGLVAALLARKETRDMLRNSAEGIVAKGKQLVSHCCGSADDSREAHEPKEERRERLGA
jgi:gas vesicle protein